MRWKCKCSYDGTKFHGWQSQACGNTIQDLIEHRLKWIFKKDVRIFGCSRTDSGVHALAQVFHFDADWAHNSDTLLRAFRCGLPKEIRVFSAEETNDDFHARFSAKGKRYIYNILEGYVDPFNFKYVWALGSRRLNVEHMNEVCKSLVGEHDFSAFAAIRGDGSIDDPIKTISKLEFVRIGNMITFTTESSGYMYKMVRSIVGTCVLVGLGKVSVEEILEAFYYKKRTNSIDTAPASGLFLDEIFY